MVSTPAKTTKTNKPVIVVPKSDTIASITMWVNGKVINIERKISNCTNPVFAGYSGDNIVIKLKDRQGIDTIITTPYRTVR